ncbi:transcriptional regulator, AlpA family [Frankia casuarinae]|jgi:predicted DNA-binding transcriptional regulator AlpA|uniref:helix-turn-helix transcriptional regulator n=1 Tax=Frankia TaxID=1854 RepID=UPI0003064F42|nr:MULTISPECIES: AlpA family phage regulatory protein [Frankia]EYT91140.1 transcriptional regulator, AlpA family [Frankia casuarinae]KDA41613.1 transcriptional regulator, AlpA family [Frankia sp. BMG5.23]TFE24175.1 AlpA family phage regulatory protein [Frankia sp. B2]
MTSSDIASLLGISQTAVNKMISKASDFPTPVIARPNFRAWRRPEVEAWLRQHRPGALDGQ